MIADERRPYLAHDVTINATGDKVSIESLDQVIELTIVSRAGPLATALSGMHGEQTVADLAEIACLPSDQFSSVCDALRVEGALLFIDEIGADAATVDAEFFAALCYQQFRGWKQRLFSHPLWASLADGTAPPQLFLGWLIENYHLIEAVTLRLSTAIAGCADPVARRHFAKHFAEEYNHHHFFRKSLRSAGLDVDRVAVLRPLPGTSAVVNHMRECARRDVLNYATCSGFLESTGDDHQRTQDFFERVSSHFDGPGAPVITPLRAHAALDEDYGHCGMLTLIARACVPITQARARRAMSDAYALVEVLELWSTDIERHYRGCRHLVAGERRYRPVGVARERQ